MTKVVTVEIAFRTYHIACSTAVSFGLVSLNSHAFENDNRLILIGC